MDSLFNISANLNEMRIELGRYNRAFVLADKESEEAGDSDDLELQTSRVYIAGGLASMILIKACAFKDEIDKHYLQYYRHTVTDVIQERLDRLKKLIEDDGIKYFRNSMLAHNNRIQYALYDIATRKKSTHYRLVKFWEIDELIPLREPEQYNDLVLLINDLTNNILGIPLASEMNP